MDPIEKLNRPTHKEVLRLSFFFKGGSAQDYNLNPEDTVEETEKQIKIVHTQGRITDRIEKEAIAYRREQTMTVKIRYPAETKPD